MSDYKNPLSNMSYTNLDFGTIFPELLDTASLLTNKWDPAASNESDPGVVLLKELAIIGDKINYNSDKNVLETFPLSVTQESNARQLFAQLGYYMKWYRSATAKITLKWSGDYINEIYTIPAFSMVSDEDKTITYTLLGEASSMTDTNVIVGDIKLSGVASKPTIVHAIEGVATEYSNNSTTTITADMIDSNNRLYFPNRYISENGIFIENVNTDGSFSGDFSSWQKVDNLMLYSLGNKYYEFNVSKDGSNVYLQFPDDISELIGSGIHLVYIQGSGEDGAISAKAISEFYSDLTSGDTVLTSDNVIISNPLKSSAGYDPETIDEAYKNYRRTIGTFDTLITLRDYNNYLLRSGLISNGFCADRTNDPQLVYKVTETNSSITTYRPVCELDTAGDKELTSYNLKLYLLNHEENIQNQSEFDSTFDLVDEDYLELIIKPYLEDAKCLSHEYASFVNSYNKTEPRMHVCFFKNVFPIEMKLGLQTSLDTTQRATIATEITSNLLNKLNASNIEFGEEITEDMLEEIVLNSDVKIKSVKFKDLAYKTYAVLRTGVDTYQEVLVSEESDYAAVTTAPTDWSTSYPNYYKLVSGEYVHYSAEAPTFTSGTYYSYDGTTYTALTAQPSDWTTNYSAYFTDDASTGNKVRVTGVEPTCDTTNLYSNEAQQIREEIYAKSVLAGRTQYFVKDEEFDYNIGKSQDGLYTDISSLSTYTKITLPQNTEVQVRDNEQVYLIKPSYTKKVSADNVRIEWKGLTVPITANQNYTLTTGQFIILYNKDSNSDLYKYRIYDAGDTVTFSYNVSLADNRFPTNSLIDSYTSAGYSKEGNTLSSETEILDDVTATNNILTSSRTIAQLLKSEVVLNTSDDYNYEYYWITSDITSNTGYFTLFNSGETEKILGDGEYFFYTNNDHSNYVQLSAGTTLKLNQAASVDWVCSTDIDVLNLLENGFEALDDLWVKWPDVSDPTLQYLTATENEIIGIPEGNYIKLIGNTTAITLDSTTWYSSFETAGVTDIYYGASGSLVKLENWLGESLKGKILLNANISSSTPIKLLSDQSITITDDSGTSTTLSTPAASTKPLCVLSKYDVVFDGDGTVGFSGNKIWSYYENDPVFNPTTTSSTWVQSTDYFTVKIPASETCEITLNTSLPAGEYILPINNSVDMTYLSVSLGDGTTFREIRPFNYSDELNKSGSHYIKAVFTNTDTQLKIKYINSTKVNTLLIYNIYKYLSGNDSLSGIESMIISLDYVKSFDYTYQVDESVEIEDPLDSTEFNNVNHIFNYATICKWDMANSSIK